MSSQTLQTGSFLLATRVLEGSYFQDRVVFLADHSASGSFGLVLNAPVHMPLEEVFSGFRSRERRLFSFFVGGPVQEDGVHVLETGRNVLPDALEVIPGIFMCALGPEQPVPVLDLFSNKSTRIHLGYSGWAAGQLENELQRGCWEIHNLPPMEVLARDREVLFPTPADFKRQFVLY